MKKRIQHILVSISFLSFFRLTNCYRFEPNTITLKNFSGCPEDERNSCHFKQTITPIARNKYTINGELHFKEVLRPPLLVSGLDLDNKRIQNKKNQQNSLSFFQLQVITRRCDFNGTQCENYDVFTVRDVCKVFSLPDQIWTDFMTNTQPKFKCPLDMKSIKISNATVDLGYIAYLPFDGYSWTFTFKIFKTNARHKKQVVYCGIYEVTVQKTHRERGKKN